MTKNELTLDDVDFALQSLRKLLENSSCGEFSVNNKIWVEVYNEPRRA
jgi:hypothetical protein